MNDIFLSYDSEDRDVARKLVNVFRDVGLSVFWDREIPVGKNWDLVLEEQLPHVGVVTPLWSPRSIKSNWVMIEATEGMEQKKLFPALIAATQIPPRFKLTQYADLSDWDGSGTHDGCARLLSAISTHLGRSFPSPPNLQREISARRERRPEEHDVFLAYARNDLDRAEALASALRAAHITVWRDSAIVVGESFWNTIQTAVEQSRAVIVLWSHRSVHSEWVLEEARMALELGLLINTFIDETTLPLPGFQRAPSVDLTQWDQKTMATPIQNLLEELIDKGVSVIADRGSDPSSRAPGSTTPSTRDSDRRQMKYLGKTKADEVEAVAVNVPVRNPKILWIAVIAIVLAAFVLGAYVGKVLLN